MFSPYTSVVASAVTYSTILGYSIRTERSHSSVRTRIKAVSAGHSIFTTCLTAIALSQRWDPTLESQHTRSDAKRGQSLSNSMLDDSQNPLISSRNTLANFVTAWEAGYLLYDTGALLLEILVKGKSRSTRSALARLIRESPVFVIHHVLLASALLWLQTYIAARREKGVKVIMAFFLMNASNPLLHLRWYRKKVTGRSDARLDAALAATFALTRFGSVYWVIQKYGQYHELGMWQALRRQRTVCQTGTGLLTGVNFLWWAALVVQMAKPTRRVPTQ